MSYRVIKTSETEVVLWDGVTYSDKTHKEQGEATITLVLESTHQFKIGDTCQVILERIEGEPDDME